MFAAPEAGVSLWVQVVGALSVAVYAFLAGLILFYGIRSSFGLRVAPRIEEEGRDIYEHGEAAYN